MVVDVSNLPISDALEDLLQDEQHYVYKQSDCIATVDANWKANEYPAPAVPRDVSPSIVL